MIFTLAALYGCGANLFKNLGLVPAASGKEAMDDLLNNAKTPEAYQQATILADAIINDPNASTAAVTEAKIAKAECILGEMGITITNLASKLATTNTNVNILDQLKASVSITQNEKLASAAFLLNETKNPADKGTELNRGITNTLALVSIVENFYNIEDNGGGVTKKDSTEDSATAVKRIYSQGAVTNSREAVDALKNAGSLTDDQQSKANNLDSVSTDMDQLNAALNGQGAYTFNDGSTKNITATSNSTEIDAAINNIFKNMK